MARTPNQNDLAILLKGLGKLSSAAFEVHSKEVSKTWSTSSLKPMAEKSLTSLQETIYSSNPGNFSQGNLSKNISEAYERLSVVSESIKAYIIGTKNFDEMNISMPDEANLSEMNMGNILNSSSKYILKEDLLNTQMIDGVYGKEESDKILEDLDSVSSLPGASAVHNFSSAADVAKLNVKKRIQKFEPLIQNPASIVGEITDEQIDAIDNKLLELQGSEHYDDLKVYNETKINKFNNDNGSSIEKHKTSEANESRVGSNHLINSQQFLKADQNLETKSKKSKPSLKLIGNKPLAKSKAKSTLSNDAQARKVPQSRISRLFTFGGLAAGLGVGTLAEMTRRSLGVKNPNNSGALLDSSPFLTEANAKRIVDTLCKVRGAALKLGQMLSIQDNSFINPELQKVFERVRQSADFMPTWQLERTLVKDFGPNWRMLVASFDEHPFAAASIGQVHQATLHDGRSVAMKIQYPGVAEGIESDINNMISTLNVAKILPEGMYVDNLIEVAKRELRWECDYKREKACTKRFRRMIEPHNEYYVPEIIEELCTKQVFTTELIEGIPVDKCVNLDQETRNYISSLILNLCLMEVFQFGYMQTDPNWSNFFYNKDTRQLALLDFGACREYSKDFVDKYINVIHGAATKDREKVEEYSKQLGFLTGHEAKVMINAHIDAVMILGEAFQYDRPFNFGNQDTTKRIQQLVPVMLSHRMCPPPEESYSLHRKMSGVFLLCAKLNGQINCKPFFDELWNGYKKGGDWDTLDPK